MTEALESFANVFFQIRPKEKVMRETRRFEEEIFAVDPTDGARFQRRMLPVRKRMWRMDLFESILQEAADAYLLRAQPSHVNIWKVRGEAELWFFSDDLNHAYSFRNICMLLNIDPVYFRTQLTRHWELYGPDATLKILLQLEPYVSVLTREDVECAVASVYGLLGRLGKRKCDWQARYTYFRILYEVFDIDEDDLREEWKRRQLRCDEYFVSQALSRWLPHEQTQAVVHKLIACAEKKK
ncbi:MAG: hypothetical protein AAB343_01565 [Patescibacteria group bacterium]